MYQWADNNLKTIAVLQPVDLAHPPAGQTLPWDWLSPGPACQQANTSFGTPWTLQPTVSGTSLTHQPCDTSSGMPGPGTRPQDPSLPAIRLSLAPGFGFTHQWVGKRPGVTWTLIPPTSEPALALGPPGVLQSAISWPGLTNQWPTVSTQGRTWQPTGLGTVVSSPQQKYSQSPQRGHS